MAYQLNPVEQAKYALYEPLEEPIILHLEPTNICNLDCVMCPRKSFSKGLGRMPLDDFKTILSKFNKLKAINLTGWGEPTLHPQLFDMANYAADMGLEVTFTTNGTFLDEKTIGRIMASKVHNIVISFDFPASEEFEAIRRNSHFGPLLEGVLRICAAKADKKVFFSVVLSSLNFKQFEGILKIAKQAGINGINLEPIYDLHGHKVPSLSPEETQTFLDALPAFEAKYGVPVETVFYSRKHSWRNWLSKQRDICPYMNTGILFVNWTGDAAPCCHHPNKFYGNLLESDAKQVWKNLEPFREKDFKDDSFCKRCYVYRRWNTDASAVYVPHDPAKKGGIILKVEAIDPPAAQNAIQPMAQAQPASASDTISDSTPSIGQ
jgi:MoaA/NifB/PqqE/SkfB family radical SAM enzyme